MAETKMAELELLIARAATIGKSLVYNDGRKEAEPELWINLCVSARSQAPRSSTRIGAGERTQDRAKKTFLFSMCWRPLPSAPRTKRVGRHAGS